MKKLFQVTILFWFSFVLKSQTTDEALRFTLPGIGVDSRALGMGNAFTSIADNFSAVYWNPAGLAQLRTIEFTAGLNYRSYNNKTTFQQNISDKTKNDIGLDDFGFVLPIPTERGSLVFAFGYTNITDHNRTMQFSGFNNKSSIIPALYDADVKYDIPFQIYLSNKKSYTPLTANVLQSGTIYEEGNGGQWNFSGAIDIEENISVGATLYGVSGNYTYNRQYTEFDQNNLWKDTTSSYPVDSLYRQFKQFNLSNLISTEYSGTGIILGFMFRSDFLRLGLTIKSPFSTTAKEVYTDEGVSFFDNGTKKGPFKYSAKNQYDINSPTSIAGGISITPFDELLLSADVEVTDWTKLQWADNSALESENFIFREKFRSVTNYRLGLEFSLTDYLQLRGGYNLEKSPIKDDPKEFDPVTFSGGIGYRISPRINLDIAAASRKFSTFHNNYSTSTISNPSRTDENINVTYVNFTLSYRL